ncbi:MAG: phosphatase PAP2 family protein [Chloroflexi bacterium]|nr:MAG: phosphatase PAP2 family protein [Chloroflexota bacterium]
MPLTARLFGIVVLGVAFILLTIAITAGAFTDLDLQVAQAMHDLWQPSLHPVFQVIAELGGFELTTLLMLGLCWYLWRSGFGSDALVFVVFVAAQAFELYYKLNLYQPSPPASLREADGPSITDALAVAGAVAAVVLMVFDRLYLDVHWESDVIGGLLLGAIALLAGTVWLDRPRKTGQ